MIKDSDWTVQLLEEVSQGFVSINAGDHLEELADQILAIFRRKEAKEMDILVLRDITYIICGKLMFIDQANFRPNSVKLYQFLKEQKLVSGLFEKFIDEKLDQLDGNHKRPKRKYLEADAIYCDQLLCSKKITTSLKQLLNISSKAGNIDKNLGFTFLDLEGNFLLLCKKSRHLFGLKHAECKIFNFFSLMVPFSKQVLAKKFGTEMFNEDNLGSITRSFNYVIYSKTALKKFCSILKGKKIESREEFDQKLESLETSNNGRNLYNAYLTALTSSATMITMKYSESDIEEWNDEKLLFKKNLRFLKTDVDSFEVATNCNKEQKPDLVYNKSTAQVDFRSINMNNGHLESPEKRCKELEGKREIIYTKRLILLKTRYSKTVPKFRYQDLKDQGILLNFKQYLRHKVFPGEEKDSNIDLLSDC